MSYLHKYFYFISLSPLEGSVDISVGKNLFIEHGRIAWSKGGGDAIYKIVVEYEKKNPVFIIRHWKIINIMYLIITSFISPFLPFETLPFLRMYLNGDHIKQELKKIILIYIVYNLLYVWCFIWLNPYRFIYSVYGKIILYLLIAFYFYLFTFFILWATSMLKEYNKIWLENNDKKTKKILNCSVYFSLGGLLILTGTLMKIYYFSKLQNTFEKARTSNNTTSLLEKNQIQIKLNELLYL